ncbi:MAG: ABC transporter permease, partial [Actinobacteria bacterium]|nr:ABC transporter permease [Actinomycetota bacterium]
SQLIPGGQARAALGPRATSGQLANFNHLNGYDQPIWQQYWNYLIALFHGDLGYSYKNNQGVTSLIADRLGKTMVLVGVSTLFALAVAIPLGMAQAVRRNRPFDYGMTAVTFILYAMPAFLAGELLIIFFSFTLNWLPSQPPTDASAWAVLTNPVPFILPILTLSALEIAAFSRYMRSAMLDTLTEDYIRTAKAKGASSRRVLWGHALRNAILPILTLIGLTLPAVVGGALITEAIFNYPGMGLLTVQAASNDDVPLVLGTTLVATIATVLGSLLADLLYAAADPRIRLGEQ